VILFAEAEGNRPMKHMGILLVAASVAAVLAGTADAEIITPTAAVASTVYRPSEGPHHLIDRTHLNDSNRHVASAFGKNFLSGDRWPTHDNWVYVDLGGPHNLDEIRIWNYHENGGIHEVAGRSVKACSLWVAPDGAALPKPATPTGQGKAAFTTAMGWKRVWAGDLKPGPSTKAPVANIGPTDTFDVTGQNGIRYIGVDIAGRWGKDDFTAKAAGLSYIQVTGRGSIACEPVPCNAGEGVSVDKALSWKRPGMYKPSGYEVYLGTDRHKVAAGDASVNVTASDADSDSTSTQYTPSSALSDATQYFWRVDSIVDGKAIPGRMWSFRTKLRTDNLGFDEIVFVKRKPYSSDHNYSVVNNGTSPDRFLAENGIYIYNLRTRQTRPVITAAGLPGGKGVIGKSSLSFDAKKVVFDYRKDSASGFRIWEANVDGSGLRQLTFAPEDEDEKVARYGVAGFHTDDMHPAYLPDGGIVFTSSRCEHGILCFYQPAVVSVILHRMDADGGNIVQLTSSPISEFSPVVQDDGRILYHRWEYVDKGARVAKTFWAMQPDGSKSEELFGLSDSYNATGAFMYAQPVPGDNSMIVCAIGPHCPQGNSVGPIKLIDLSKDNRTAAPLTNITPGVEVHPSQAGWLFDGDNFTVQHNDGVGGLLYGHPYPVNEKQFLVSHKDNPSDHYMGNGAYSIYLIDTDGNKAFICEDEDGTVSCWHPTPLLERKTPPVIQPPVSKELQEKDQALCLVINIYEGMEGVEPGSIRYIRINEAVPLYWDAKRKWSPRYDSSQWSAALWPRVQWGIVPVEKDGSACFTVPADRNIFFQALDENYMEVQRERTYVNYKPGETRACIGCHERSGKAPPSTVHSILLAQKRPPSTPGPQPGETDPHQVIDYPSDIQPILDAKCVSCHGDPDPDGKLNLTGAITTYHNVSFEQIRNKGLAGPILSEFVHYSGADHANMNGSYLPPKNLGSYKSKLLSTIRTTDRKDPHYGLLSKAALLKIIRWVDTNYQFYGAYYGRHHGAHAAHPDFRRKATFEEAISPRAPDWHK